jgi:hypothetical protein
MKQRLLWKLLLINSVPVIGVIILVVWLAIDQLAADYFTVLMERYHVSPTDTHRMFLSAIHRYGLGDPCRTRSALALSYLLTRQFLSLMQMAAVSAVAAGNFHNV